MIQIIIISKIKNFFAALNLIIVSSAQKVPLISDVVAILCIVSF